MSLSRPERELGERFLATFLDTARALQRQSGADPEVTLEALVESAEQLRGRLEQELAELRVEQAE